MNITNFEFKAVVKDIDEAEKKLNSLHPVFIGEDRQIDTYFSAPTGRLKLREGNIEHALIWYQRENLPSGKRSDILLYNHSPDDSLKQILIKILGVKIIVSKIRRIYFIDNVKFHFDRVEGLGTFMEVEAIDQTGMISLEGLKAQCDKYISFFKISEKDFVKESYADLMSS